MVEYDVQKVYRGWSKFKNCRNKLKSVLMMKNGEIIDQGKPTELIDKHGRTNLEEVFLKLSRSENEFN